jgi:threonine dehydrogenase-like Zn-dependent dehydrogenase
VPTLDRITFSASEYQADGSIRPASYAFHGSGPTGWEILREGAPHLRLGPGYRLLRSSHCGVCATDLARRHLPFPLPQVTGHEVVALDEANRPVAVEINASHAARGAGSCAHCERGLPTHCPDRLVLGIHALPGGFSPWLLAPAAGVIPLPAGLDPATAALVEPFAAALHAVRAIDPAGGERVAVLGPGRLGSLVLAALAAWRTRSGRRYEILAITRRHRARARAFGADDVLDPARAASMRGVAGVVIDTTGRPEGLPLAAALATREVHVKSTTGQPTAGLAHLTELVVDELSLAPLRTADLTRTRLPSPPPRTAVLLGDVPPGVAADLEARGLRVLGGDDPVALADALARDPAVPLAGADLAVVTSLAAVDAVVRPRRDRERGLVRARGSILVADVRQPRDGLLAAVLDRGLRLTTTRCGDFRAALDVLTDPAHDLRERLGTAMVSRLLPADRLAEAFAAAAGPDHLKVLVTHPGGLL